MNAVIKILMDRDGYTHDEAVEIYNDTYSELMDAIDGTSCLDPEDVLAGIGLEMDYIWAFI